MVVCTISILLSETVSFSSTDSRTTLTCPTLLSTLTNTASACSMN